MSMRRGAGTRVSASEADRTRCRSRACGSEASTIRSTQWSRSIAIASMRVGASHGSGVPSSALHTGRAVRSASCVGEASERARVSRRSTSTRPAKTPTTVKIRMRRALEGSTVSLEASALVITRPALAWYGSSWATCSLSLLISFVTSSARGSSVTLPSSSTVGCRVPSSASRAAMSSFAAAAISSARCSTRAVRCCR